MKIEKIYFNSVDNLNLIGLLHLPEKETTKVVISVHGITSSCLKKKRRYFSEKVYRKRNCIFCI